MASEDELKKVRAVVAQFVRGKKFQDATALVSGGLIDSLVLVDVILELESAFGIPLPVSELQPDDFDSVNKICETIARFR